MASSIEFTLISFKATMVVETFTAKGLRDDWVRVPLASGADTGEGGRPDDHVEVGVLIDDESVVAAKLQLLKNVHKFYELPWPR